MNKATSDVSLFHDMFKWTNVICLSAYLLISSRMDVVIIATKLVCHLNLLCFQIGLFLWLEQYVMVVLQLPSSFHTPFLGEGCSIKIVGDVASP